MFDMQKAKQTKREHRRWLDRVHVHGPELFDALKQLVRAANEAAGNPSNEIFLIEATGRAEALIEKLDGKQ